MPKIECYFISGSPPCWSIMLALAVKGLPYEPRRLDNAKREQKSDAFLAINPRGNVPTLIDDTVTVRETNAILAYLEAAYPDPPLMGNSPAHAAEIWQILCEADDRLRTPIGNVSRPIFRGRAKEMVTEIQEAIQPVHQELAVFERVLADRAYLCGATLTAADIAVYPALMQLQRCATREGAASLGLQVTPLDSHYPNLAAWAERIEAVPGYADAYPPHWR
ncbi:MAG: glutathione S-transferase family protein [Stappiaceae bacterium]